MNPPKTLPIINRRGAMIAPIIQKNTDGVINFKENRTTLEQIEINLDRIIRMLGENDVKLNTLEEKLENKRNILIKVQKEKENISIKLNEQNKLISELRNKVAKGNTNVVDILERAEDSVGKLDKQKEQLEIKQKQLEAVINDYSKKIILIKEKVDKQAEQINELGTIGGSKSKNSYKYLMKKIKTTNDIKNLNKLSRKELNNILLKNKLNPKHYKNKSDAIISLKIIMYCKYGFVKNINHLRNISKILGIPYQKKNKQEICKLLIRKLRKFKI